MIVDVVGFTMVTRVRKADLIVESVFKTPTGNICVRASEQKLQQPAPKINPMTVPHEMGPAIQAMNVMAHQYFADPLAYHNIVFTSDEYAKMPLRVGDVITLDVIQNEGSVSKKWDSGNY